MIDNFDESNPIMLKRKRARTPHSKSGCITCKIRHIKCDERKPLCERCEKSGWSCDGYQVSEPLPTRSRRNSPIKIVPKPISRLPSPSLSHTPPVPVQYQNQEEFRCFQSFREQTVYQLSGFLDFDLWGGIVLPACEGESSLRHAAIALGSLNFQAGSDRNPNEKLLEREFAYAQYSKAIEEIWSATHEGTCSIRTNLIASLLFACFELFNENTESAYAQILSGLKLIKDWGLKPSASYSVGYPGSSTATNQRVVEDEILHAFGRLEIRATTYCDSKNMATYRNELHSHHNQSVIIDINGIGRHFPNLAQARAELELLSRQALPYYVAPNLPANAHNFLDPALLSIELSPEFYAIISALKGWETSFAPIWEQAQHSDSRAIHLGAASLRLQYLNIFLLTWTYTQDESVFCERFELQLIEMLELSRILIANTPKYPNGLVFSLEGLVVLPLVSVCLRFRNRRLKKTATQLLLNNARHEGVWMSKGAGRIMQWVQDLEEQGLEDDVEFVPAARVVRQVEWRDEGRTTRIRCLQQSLDRPGEWIQREKLLIWDRQDETTRRPRMELHLQVPEPGPWM